MRQWFVKLAMGRDVLDARGRHGHSAAARCARPNVVVFLYVFVTLQCPWVNVGMSMRWRAPLASMATFSEVPLFSSGRGVGLMAFFAIYDFVVFGVPDVLAAWSSFRKAEVFPHERIHILY